MRRLRALIGATEVFLLTGAILLAVGSSYISPSGPWFVLGAISLAVGAAGAIQSTRSR